MDQKKIEGMLVAFGRAGYREYKEGKKGFVFPENNGFGWKVDPFYIESHGITMEMLTDCIEQLEEMFKDDLLKKDGIRKNQGFFNNGLVVTSRLNPQLKASVTFHNPDYEDVDISIGWFYDEHNDGSEANNVPERAVDDEELKAVEKAREAAANEPEVPYYVSGKQKTESVESLLGLESPAPKNNLMESIQSNKDRYLRTKKVPLEEGAKGNRDDITDYPEFDSVIKKVIDKHMEKFSDKADQVGYGLEPKIDEIESQRRDGFIPHTNGGYQVRMFVPLESMQFADIKDEKAQKAIDDQINYNTEIAVEEFKKDHAEELKGFVADDLNPDTLRAQGHEDLAEELQNKIDSLMNEDSIMYEIGVHFYAQEKAEDKHSFYAYGVINWESPYFRSGKGNEAVLDQIDIETNSPEELEKELDGAFEKIINKM